MHTVQRTWNGSTMLRIATRSSARIPSINRVYGHSDSFHRVGWNNSCALVRRRKQNDFSILASAEGSTNDYPTTELRTRSRRYHSSSTHSNKQNTMKLSRHAPVALLFTTAAVLSLQPGVPLCHAEKFRLFSSKTEDPSPEISKDPPQNDKASSKKKSGCPFYGCPLKPIDVHYNTDDLKQALAELRNDKRLNVVATGAARMLSSSATDQHVTLTLIGYKGGTLESQINQDRSVIVSPYTVYPIPANDENAESSAPGEEKDKENKSPNDLNPPEKPLSPGIESFLKLDRTLLGAFDGHAPLGEKVSEYTATELPKLLATKLTSKAAAAASETLTEKQQVEITKDALIETFVELDGSVPADPSGGCTATVILHQGTKVYVANAGDSRSFVVAYRPSTNNVTITYISREDKPDLPDERARVEAAGGQVYIPARGTSRVVYHDALTGAPTGLAMSRSIGDWEAGKMGVIPNPIVDVLDTQALVAQILMEDAGDVADTDAYQVDTLGSIVGVSSDYEGRPDDDVYLFAVSATDGMMDYLAAPEIARVLAHALFDEAGAHPVTAAEHLIFAAANAWQQAKQGRYRDDIAIAAAAIRWPPASGSQQQQQQKVQPQPQ